MTFLTGKKTYILGVCGILYAVFGYASGNLDFHSALAVVFASLAAMGLRNGMTTEIQTVLGAGKTLPKQ